MHCPHCHQDIINEQEIRQRIREELMHLDPDVANSVLAQLTMRLGRSIQAQSGWRRHEVKASDSEVVQDEP